ncbi:GlcG/HbpS family heme-binding protein [Alsobacter sp. R-9]
MPDITLAQAQSILAGAIEAARAAGMMKLCIAVLDTRGALKALASEDGTSLERDSVARGKAYGALSMGFGSRTLHRMAVDRPHFIFGVGSVIEGPMVAVPGGVLIRDAAGTLLGAVGISGDNSDNDEKAAIAGIVAAGLVADPGQ